MRYTVVESPISVGPISQTVPTTSTTEILDDEAQQ